MLMDTFARTLSKGFLLLDADEKNGRDVSGPALAPASQRSAIGTTCSLSPSSAGNNHLLERHRPAR